MSLRRPARRAVQALALAALLLAPCLARAEASPEELLPTGSCGPGWQVEGKALSYDRDTLSDRIDGEAELYFPYGFERMAAARYGSVKTPGAGIDVEIYRMGSLLDAFGMYANYRQKEGRSLGVGADSSLAASQLFLYQGRYFVQVQITGTDHPDSEALAQCGRSVAARLPGPARRPAELAVFDRPDLVKGSERYLPESLLGYDFLNKGIMADAAVGASTFRVFLLLGTTAQSASAASQRYRTQMVSQKNETVGADEQIIEGVDALYGPVTVVRKGACLAGALKSSEGKEIRGLLESLCHQ